MKAPASADLPTREARNPATSPAASAIGPSGPARPRDAAGPAEDSCPPADEDGDLQLAAPAATPPGPQAIGSEAVGPPATASTGPSDPAATGTSPSATTPVATTANGGTTASAPADNGIASSRAAATLSVEGSARAAGHEEEELLELDASAGQQASGHVGVPGTLAGGAAGLSPNAAGTVGTAPPAAAAVIATAGGGTVARGGGDPSKPSDSEDNPSAPGEASGSEADRSPYRTDGDTPDAIAPEPAKLTAAAGAEAADRASGPFPEITTPARGDTSGLAGLLQPAGSMPVLGSGQVTTAPALAPHPIVEGVAVPAVPVEVGLKSLAGVNRFEIRLAPEELGRVDVSLDITEDGQVQAHLVVDRPETLARLQRETGHLERALEQAGLKTGDGGLSVTLRDPSGSESGMGRGPDAGARDEGRGRGAEARPARESGEAEDRPTAPPRRLAWGRASGIDLRI